MAFFAFPQQHLVVRSIASSTNEWSARIRLENGESLVVTSTHAGDRTGDLDLSQGEIHAKSEVVELIVQIASGVKRGQFYCDVGLNDGTFTSPLAKGYVYDGHALSLGQFVEPGPGGGDGFPRNVGDETLNDSDKTFTVPTNAIWEIRAIRIKFNTSATAGTRVPAWIIADDLGVVRHAVNPGGVAASQEVLYEVGPFYRRTTNAAGDTAFALADDDGSAVGTTSYAFPLSLPIRMYEGWTIRFFDQAAIDVAADDMLVRIGVEEWLVI